MSAGHSSIFELNFFGWLNSNQKQRQPQRKRIMFDDCKTDDPVVSIRNSGNGAKKFFFRKRMISNSVLTSSKHFAELKRENGRKMERRPSTSSLPAVSFNKCTSISRSREDRKVSTSTMFMQKLSSKLEESSYLSPTSCRSSSSSGYGTTSNLSLGTSGDFDEMLTLNNFGSQCTLVSAPLAAKNRLSPSMNDDIPSPKQITRRGDSLPPTALIARNAPETASSIFIETKKNKLKSRMRPIADSGTRDSKAFLDDTHPICIEGDNEAYLVSLATSKKIIVFKRRQPFFSSSSDRCIRPGM